MPQPSHESFWRRYLGKMRGGVHRVFKPDFHAAAETFICAFAIILILAKLVDTFTGDWTGVMLIPSFGASCILIFGTPESENAQPRNVIGGHVVAALAGVGAYTLFGASPIAAAFAVALSGAAMHLTGTMHPPGGATALLAVIGDEAVRKAGIWYAIMPVGAGAVIIVLMGVLINNLCLHRRYPARWS